MKSFLSIILFFASLSFVQAQCNAFFPIREGVKFSYDYYDKKDKLTLKTVQWMKDVSGSGNSMKATLVQEMIDAKKNKSIGTTESEWVCDDGTLHFAINNMAFEGQAAAPNPSMTVDVTGDKMDIPSSFTVGESLKDLNYQVKMTVSGMTIMNRKFSVTDRKVLAQEKVETPAGAFDCYKVSFNTTSEGGIGAGTTKTTIWYAKDVGMVKTENYSEKGNLTVRQVLSKIEK